MSVDEEFSSQGWRGAPPGEGRNGERDFHGEKRSNDSHASTTDPDARLYKKAAGQVAKLCHMAHLLMENRHGLVVEAFGWSKTVGGMRKTNHCSTALADWMFTLKAAAYNLFRMPKLLTEVA